MFSCEISEIFKNTYFEEDPRTNASELERTLLPYVLLRMSFSFPEEILKNDDYFDTTKGSSPSFISNIMRILTELINFFST